MPGISFSSLLVLLSMGLFSFNAGALSDARLLGDGDVGSRSVVLFVMKWETGWSSCTGSISSPHTILLAAHCIVSEEGQFLGKYATAREAKTAGAPIGSVHFRHKNTWSAREAVDFEVRPGYDPSKMDNRDLAVVRFAGAPFPFSQEVNLVPQGQFEDALEGASAIAIGFGVDPAEIETNYLPIFQSKNTDRIVRNLDLKTKKLRLINKKVNEPLLATAGPQPGDSGGPLFVNIEGRVVQVGVAMGGGGTEDADYTYLPEHFPWIQEILLKLE